MAPSSMKASLMAMLPTPGYGQHRPRRWTYNSVPARLATASDRLVHHVIGYKEVRLELPLAER